MKVKYCPASFDEVDLCPDELEVLRLVSNDLKKLFAVGISEKSASELSKWFENFARNSGWIYKFRFGSNIPLSRAYANYLMDATTDMYEASCGHNHRINFQLCLDNRQAIGTNLLKFQVASSNFLNKPENRCLSVIIGVNKAAKKHLSLDNSVGTLDEYETAIRTAYAEILNIPIFEIALEL